jgi:outer membrane protein assembly factor BamA
MEILLGEMKRLRTSVRWGKVRTPAGFVKRSVGRLAVVAALFAAVPTTPLAGQEDGRRLVVRSLTFEGNRAISDAELRISIATSQSSAFARRPALRWLGLGERRFFDEIEFRRDVQRIQALYRVSGFIDATVDTIVRRSDRDANVRFLIYEGQPVRVTSLTVSGVENIVPDQWLLRNIPLHLGDPFSRLQLQASVDNIKAVLRDRGYPFAEVYRNFDEDRDSRTAQVNLVVDPGPLVTVTAVEVTGADRIDDAVVRRALSVEPGQRFSGRALRQSQLDLYRMDLFNYVSVGLADSASIGEPDSAVTVRVRVSEGPFQRVRLGAGFGTIDCFRTLGSWTVGNFLGGGRSLRLNARLSQIGVGSSDPLSAGFENSVCNRLGGETDARLRLNYNVSVSLREPFVLSRNTSATVSLFAERHSEFQAYVRQAVGGELDLTQVTQSGLPVTLRYSLSRGRTEAEPANFCSFFDVCVLSDLVQFTRRRVRSVLSLGIARDRSNALLDPSSGSRLTVEVRHASTFIGSDELSQFNKAVIEFASYHPVGRRGVFAWRIRFGTILPPTSVLSVQAVKFVPPEERFYAGGPSSVRGFGRNELGPLVRVIDTVLTTDRMIEVNGKLEPELDSIIRTSATGGNDILVANAELRFPLPGFDGRLSGALFVDAGQVFNREREVYSLRKLRVTPGAGFRVLSPLGPIRLDVGFNPHASEIDRTPLFERRNGTLVQVANPPAPERGFLGRLRVHFSVGQAF